MTDEPSKTELTRIANKAAAVAALYELDRAGLLEGMTYQNICDLLDLHDRSRALRFMRDVRILRELMPGIREQLRQRLIARREYKDMHPPEKMTRIIERKRYSVATATLIASDEYWDGSNWERSGRNCFLYRTPNGAYFTVNMTMWQGERDTLTPVSLEDAIDLFEGALTEHMVSYAEAFPTVKAEDA